MNQDNMFAMAFGMPRKNPELDAQNPLITREMYAVKPNGSIVKTLSRHLVSLLTAVKTH
jgi:hypothetical protein